GRHFLLDPFADNGPIHTRKMKRIRDFGKIDIHSVPESWLSEDRDKGLDAIPPNQTNKADATQLDPCISIRVSIASSGIRRPCIKVQDPWVGDRSLHNVVG